MEVCDHDMEEYPNSFLIHKPINVLCSTIDDAFKEPMEPDNEIDNNNNLRRKTVYDVAASSHFPTNYSLVGRLDFETSGIMLFTKNHELFMEINTPITIESAGNGETTEELNKLYEYKMKVYQVKLLAGSKLVAMIRMGKKMQKEELERELSQPFSFARRQVKYEVKEFHNVRVDRIYQDELFTKGRQDLGWCVDVEITILEGKHHQIRRMAARNSFIVVSLHRKRIAGILSIDERLITPGSCRWVTRTEEQTILENIQRLRQHLLGNNSVSSHQPAPPNMQLHC